MVDHSEIFSSKRRDHLIQKVDIDKIIKIMSTQLNMQVDELKYYIMKILIPDSMLAGEFNNLLIAAKLTYSDEANTYTDMITKMEESFRQQDELLEKIKFEELLLRSQLRSNYGLKAQVIDKSIIHQIKT